MNADPVFYYPEWKQAAIDALVAQLANIRQQIDAYERCRLSYEGLRRQETATYEALRTIDRMDQPVGRGSSVPYEMPEPLTPLSDVEAVAWTHDSLQHQLVAVTDKTGKRWKAVTMLTPTS